MSRLVPSLALLAACAPVAEDGEVHFVDGPGPTVAVSARGADLGDGAPRLATVAVGRESAVLDTEVLGLRDGDCFTGPRGRLRLVTCLPTVERQLTGVVEQFHRELDGVGQSWVLSEAPAGAGPVVLEVAFGDATLTQDGADVDVTMPSGERWTYAGLHAWDANDVELPAWMTVDGDVVRLFVDDTDAIWPLLVDPVLSTASRTLTEVSTDYGISVAMDGDINGDNYADLVVGARFGTGLYGEAFTYHGSSTGIGASYARKLSGADYYGKFGEYVANGGDLNHDGYDDVVVSEFYSERALVYLGSATGIGTTAATTVTGPYGFGRAVAIVGDMNGDTYDDVAFGAQEPAFLIHLGTSSHLGASPTVNVATAGEPSVARAGDTNGDGYADAVYGVAADNTVRVLRGAASMTGTTTSLTRAGSVALGFSVAGGADFNGDGYGDVASGDPSYSSNRGRVIVFFGSSSGVTSANYQELPAPVAGSGFGYTVAAVGDVNGDGYDDLAVADDYDHTQVYLFHGSASGLVTTPVQTFTGDANLGYAISGGGDVNRDTYADLVLGNIGGSVYVYHGCADVDRDGQCSDVDCNDNDAAIKRGATELPGDQVDQDCDGQELCYRDADNDNYRLATTLVSTDGDCVDSGEAVATDLTGDCNDARSDTYPGAVEVPGDEVDQNCDANEVCYVDADGDGYRLSTTRTSTDADCDDVGEAASSVTLGDCNDAAAAVNAAATELPGDEVDQNCDNAETCYVDADGDGFRLSSTTASSDTDCDDAGEAVTTDTLGDCDDAVAAVNASASELPGDEVDQNCDNAETCYVDADDDGYRLASTTASSDTDCDDAGEAVTTDTLGDCNDAVAAINAAATELPGDEVDQNCDGAETCYVDADNDAYRLSSTTASADTDCDDAGEAVTTDTLGDCNDGAADVNAGASEVAGDEADQNCDGAELCFVDADDDDYRTAATTSSDDLDCTDAGEATSAVADGDCDDGARAVYPGAVEVIGNETDEDCDGAETCFADADGDSYRTAATVASADADCTDAGEAASAVAGGDCDDDDAGVNPGMSEVVGDEIDQDCDGGEKCLADGDGDGFRTDVTVTSVDVDCDDVGEAAASMQDGDCDDSAFDVKPTAAETVGDEVDQNCNGGDTCYVDADDDGYRIGDLVSSVDLDCTDAGEARASDETGDCDDTSAQSSPAGIDIPGDTIDQDCSGADATAPDTDGEDTDVADTDVEDTEPVDSDVAPSDDTDDDATTNCGCATSDSSGLAYPLLGAVALLVRRRRR